MNAPDVHIVNSGIDFPASSSNFIEACGLHPMVLARSSGNRHEADLEVGLLLDHPDLMPLGRLDHARRDRIELRGKSVDEGIFGFHQMIVDGNERVVDGARLRIGRERFAYRPFDAEFYGFDHISIPCPHSSTVQAEG